ncbi:MAG: flagellar biosynthesis protein FlhA [Proteobacteria bacterium]|nr:flagellar biosynthesis protein FlhA [Pseudomonadota bacterium]
MNGVLGRFQFLLRNADVLVSIVVIGIILMMVLPMSPFMMDLFLVFSIMASLGILLISMYTAKPLDFSVFPTVLLLATLLRLSLNIASTRLILTHGHEGASSAGAIISSFGEVVVGGNYVVGFVVFVILVIINFVVITKGAGRVSEVAARFTLDALPGKQMAIDADLNAGIINEETAKKRRKEIEAEADFYGSMDGASKFVRGDAIAGILITVVNIVGGLIIGTVQMGLDVGTAAQTYILLTVGDGLASQIPALIISTAAGLVVTRASSSGETFGQDFSNQVFMNEKIFYILSGALLGMGLFLRGAFIPFAVLSSMCGFLGYLLKTHKANEILRKSESQVSEALENRDKVESTPVVDGLQLEVGYGLISIVDNNQGGDLLERIQGIRKQFAQEQGIVVPPVNIRDNLQLKPGEYLLYVKGIEVGRGELMIDHYLAMDPGGNAEKVDGLPAKEPVFNLDAVWITDKNRELAQLAGYTVVDLQTVIATHITEVIRQYSFELIGRQEIQTLLEIVKKTHPKVVEEVIPKEISLGMFVRIIKNLIKEQVPVRDLVLILEAVGDAAIDNKDIDFLTESVRVRLARTITGRLIDESGQLPLMTFSREIEEKLIGSVHVGDKNLGTQFLVDPSLVKQIIPRLSHLVDKLSSEGVTPVILVTPMIRHHVKRLLERFLPQVNVISHNEIHPSLQVRSVGTVEVA